MAKTELHKLLSVVDPKLVVSFDTKTGTIYIGGQRADAQRLANLKSEAAFFEESDLWNILNQTIRELAQRAMFVDGKTLEDMQKGRSMLFLLDTQKKIVETFKAFIPRTEPQNPRRP